MMPMSSKCNRNHPTTLSLQVTSDSLRQFTTLLQSGIFLSMQSGGTIGELLTSLPGFSQDYIQRQVQTIFVNGLPADSLDQRIVEENTVIAISAAMPGLAGAIFRKAGAHASLRTATAQEQGNVQESKDIPIRLKLFNVIAKERGLDLLAKGCFLKSSGVEKFLAYRPPLMAAIQKCSKDGQAIDLGSLQNVLHNNETILLTIHPFP